MGDLTEEYVSRQAAAYAARKAAEEAEDLDVPDGELTAFGRLVREVVRRLYAEDYSYVHFGSDTVDGDLAEVVRAVLAEQGQPDSSPIFVSG